ncbi:hypothetical protein JCM10207_002965 [Rhodosporidiobolus poonsookiae]
MRSSKSLAALLALALPRVALVAAQSSSASSASATSTSTAASASSTAKPTIALPPLYECTSSTWTYTAPVAGPKYLGVYVSGSKSFLETYALPSVYDDRLNGTFTWNCDLPAGLSVAFQFYVLQDGASGTDGQQASTTDAIVNAGSSGSACLGTNDAGSQGAILSLASSLDPNFTYTGDGAKTTGTASSGGSSDGDSTNIGAIVGGVVGGVCGIALVALALIYLKRKHDLAAANNADGLSLYSGRSEKRGSMHNSRFGGTAGSTAGLSAPPPGTYYAHDEHGNTILMMGYPGAEQDHPFTPPLPEHASPATELTPMSPAPIQTAPPGMLPEPMDDSAPAVSSAGAAQQHSTAVPPSSPSGSTADPFATPAPFTPRSERDAYLGAQGLDDPSSFSPSRRRG